MGICTSCLGRRRLSESEQSDSSHLLGDQHQPNYGATGSAHSAPQPDPEELRRQRETLERICAETSEQLICVSQPSLLPEISRQSSKSDEYAPLFNERFRSLRERPTSAGTDNKDEDETTWLDNVVGNQGGDELEQIKPAHGKLTIQFGAR